MNSEIVDLLRRADAGGVRIRVADQSIVLHCDRGPVSAELREEIRRNKNLILELLREQVGADVRIPCLTAQPRRGAVPLSFAQERLWFLEQLGVSGSAYNIPAALRLRGALAVDVLERSFAELVRRHESLRTRFETRGPTVVQVIEPPGSFVLERIDLSGLAAEERQREGERHLQQLAQARFDLARGPVFRVALLEAAIDDHVLLMTMHHIVSDGWSMSVLIRELRQLYTAFFSGSPAALAEPRLQYADYALWQRGWLQGVELERQLSFWRQQLADAPALLELPTDRARPEVASFCGAQLSFRLEARLHARLTELAQGAGATLFMVLLAAFKVLLSRLSGQEDIVVGSGIAGRTHRELEELVGFFVNTLALRTRVQRAMSFRELLERVREVTLGAYAHQDLPFERLVAEIQPERDLAHQPLFQAVMTLQNVPRESLELPGLTVNRLATRQTTSKSDLLMFAFESPEGIRCVFEYATELFDDGTIRRWMSYYERIVTAIAADPDIAVGRIPLLSARERTDLLSIRAGLSRQNVEVTEPACVHELIEEVAAASPQATAVVFANERWTFAELNGRANQLAHRLRRLGAGPDVIVGLCVRRSERAVLAILGILRAGAAYLPLDDSLPPQRLAFMLADAGSTLIVTQSGLAAALPANGFTHVLIDDEAEVRTLCEEPVHAPQTGVRPENLACVIYTSGSTGIPKGVLLLHRALRNLVDATRSAFGFGPDDRLLQFIRLTFDVSAQEILVSLCSGATLCMMESPRMSLGAELARCMRQLRVTTAMLPSSVLPSLEGQRFPDLRRLFVGGESFDGACIPRWVSQCRFINEYGPTETTVCATYAEFTAGGDHSLSIGRPLANVQVHVLDPDLEPVPPGVAGELYIAGVGLARGYLRRPGYTAERFIACPYGGDGSRMYRSGDRVRCRDDGCLEFLGRADQQIKLRGHRVELGEIESVLLAQPGVRQAVVTVREDVDGERQLIAYAVPHPELLRLTQPSQVDTLGADTVDQWQKLFEDGYETVESDAPSFVGWNSSYTGQPIAEDHMEQWLRATVERVVRLRPDEVLEIGCGVGLILWKLAPQCSRYRGIDFSAAAIARLSRWAAERPELRNVELAQQEARDLDAIPSATFDTVLLNSVIQYFPDVGYLIAVLLASTRIAAPHGRVFVGDVRHAGLLEVFHTSVQLAKAGSELTLRDLRRRIARAIAREPELALQPELFHVCAGSWGLGAVEVQLKRGAADNELIRYRYDVVLHGSAVRLECGWSSEVATDFETLDWSECGWSIAQLAAGVRAKSPSGMRIRGVINRRLARDIATFELVRQATDERTVGELLRQVRELPDRGEDPEAFWRLAEDLGYEVRIYWSLSPDAGSFDVLLWSPSRLGERATVGASQHTRTQAPAARPPDWGSYANAPLAGRVAQQFAEQLEAALRVRLPEYMIPTACVILDELPLTPHGKVDRRRLPEPDGRLDAAQYVAPRTTLEQALAAIWAQILKLDRVGLRDNFFRLGGHSLLATRVVSQMREALGVELPLRALFENPTVGQLAAHLVEQTPAAVAQTAPPLHVQERSERIPLSFAQERLWFLEQLGLGGAAYNIPMALVLKGPLDERALRSGLRELVRRHESLRTRFESMAGVPAQVIDPAESWDLERVDLSGLDAQLQEQQLRELRAVSAECRFDLARGPNFRATLLRCGAREHVLLLAMHHIVSDGWSIGVVWRELSALYAAFSQGRAPQLEPLPIQYADYAIWQRRWLQGEELQRQLEYWRGRLEGAVMLQLPLDRARPPVASSRGSSLRVGIPAQTSGRLAELAQDEGATLFMALLAAFQMLLSRLSGQRDIIVGSPIAGRRDRHTEGLIGFFVNMLVLRSQFEGDPSYVQVLRQVRENTLAAYAHQDIPFEKLVAELQPQRDLSRQPLFQVTFMLQNTPRETLQLPGVQWQGSGGGGAATARFDLTLSLSESAEGLHGVFEYRTDLFDADTIVRWSRQLTSVLAQVSTDPRRRLSQLQLLSPAEREQLLVEWNATDSVLPAERSVHELFAAQAARTPDAEAVCHGGVSLTYGELERRATRLARQLRSRGVCQDQPVGIVLERSLEMVVAWLGILKAGGACVPLDPALPPERLAYILEDAAPGTLVTHRSLRPLLPALAAQVIELDLEAVEPAGSAGPEPGVDAQSLVYVIYTSGSTGWPKGTQMTHRSMVNLIEWHRRAFSGTGARVLQYAALGFDVAFQEIFSTLCTGGTLLLLDAEVRRDVRELYEFLDGQGVQRLFLPPLMLQSLAEYAVRRGTTPQGLRDVITAGEPLRITPEIVSFFERSSGCRLHNHYGPTETHVVTSLTLGAEPRQWPALPAIGRPISNVRVYILDEHHQPVPVGVIGEIHIGGVAVARGYLGRPGLTAQRFTADPFDSAHPATLYDTGDLGRWQPDGNIEFLGRKDRQVKIRGYRVEPAEVEAVLLEQIEISEAVVVAHGSSSSGRQLVAYAVAQQPVLSGREQAVSGEGDARIAAAEMAERLRQRLRSRLPEYMIPGAFVWLDRFPLTASGKVDRDRLPAPSSLSSEDFVAPRTAAEEALAQIWARVLGTHRVGVNDNFFELGGHSLLATQLFAQLQASLNVELPLRTIFEAPTVAALAARLGRESGVPAGVDAESAYEEGEV